MPAKKPRTYGTKKSAVAKGSSAIFGATPASPPRDAVDDLTTVLAETTLHEIEDTTTSSLSSSSSSSTTTYSPEVSLPGLELLTTAHKADTGHPISVLPWSSVLPPGSDITKIAEASFAEVYRISTISGSSIIKIMQLQIPSDPASYSIETAASVSSVVSEIRIMNALTEVPGYVTFKGTYIVQGPPPQEIVAAYDEHLESHQFEDGSYFPHPETGFNENSTFLVLELGDAGNVLERVEIDHLNKVWDLFLGVVMALSRAEITNEFEHRDLHENNICVRVIGTCDLSSSPGDLRFGQSGLEVTLIDYGLSRARLESGEVIYNNLEADLALFHSEETGIAGIQFDTYRRMRTHMIEKTHTMRPSAWHDSSSLPPSITAPWEEFTPYTNVLWIRYILTYLLKTYQAPGLRPKERRALNHLTAEIKELQKRLNVKTKVSNGAFTSAQEVLAFVVDAGWVTEEQLERYGVDESTLGEVSKLIEDSDDKDDSEGSDTDDD